MNAEQLKASLLQQAIEGKLVPQLEEDPSVEQIGEAPKDVPFAIPEKWKWVHLCKIVQVINGDRGTNYPAKSKLSRVPTKNPFVSAANLQDGKISKDDLFYLSDEQYNSLRCGKILSGDLLLCIRGSLGKFGLTTSDGGAIASSLVILRNDSLTTTIDFLVYYIQSKCFFNCIADKQNGTAQPNLGASELKRFLIPLPPIAEQHRIVEKLNALLPLVEEYGNAYDRLTRINKEFPSQLKASLLQQAIEGKLVPQLEEDPSVEQIGEAPKDVPFAIPEKWKWVHFSAVAELLNGRAYKKEELLQYKAGCTPIIRVGNFFTSSKWYYSDLQLEENKYCDNGDLLFAWSASFGPKIWNGGRAIYHYHIWKVAITEYIDKNWLYWWLSYKCDSLKKSGHGSTMIHVTKNGMEHELLALPPIAEQRRIVEKLNALLPLVDEMTA